MVLLGVLWLLLQVPLVTGPPATAVFYAICLRIYKDEVWDYQDMWLEFCRLFGASWRWGGPNVLVVLLVAGNFVAYQGFEGGVWDVLRVVWGGVGLGWLMVNLFYWPFWLAQEDQSVKVTYQNVGRFFCAASGGDGGGDVASSRGGGVEPAIYSAAGDWRGGVGDVVDGDCRTAQPCP